MKDLLKELAASIAFALRKTHLRPRHHDAGRNDTEVAIAADTIAKHLVLANWRFAKGPPSPHHSTPAGPLKETEN